MNILGTRLAPTVVVDSTTDHIHEGVAYEISSSMSLTSGDTVVFVGVSTDKEIHFHGLSVTTSSGPLTMSLIENPTIDTQGNSVVAMNRNRTSTLDTSMDIYTGGAVSGGTVLGTRKIHDIGGGVHVDSGAAGFEGEWLLKPNSAYAVVEEAGDDMDLTTVLFWYEV